MSEDTQVIAIDSLGNIVPCHFILSTSKEDNCILFENSKLEIIITKDSKGDGSAEIKPKTGSNTNDEVSNLL